MGAGMTLDETFLPIDAKVPACQTDAIRIGAFQERSFVAGPGCRAVIWVTGCLRRCPGCMKPEFLPFDIGKLVTICEMVERISAIDGLDGVTYSGGEPFEQSAPLAKLSRRLKQTGLSIAAYSGYRHEAPTCRPSPIWAATIRVRSVDRWRIPRGIHRP